MRIIIFALVLIVVSSNSFGQQAREIKIGIPPNRDNPTDVFINSFASHASLKEENINIRLIEMNSISPQSEYVDLLRKHVYDFAFISIKEISASSNVPLPYAQLLDVPLIFSDVKEQLRIQQSLYGDTVIAEIGQTGILPLAFWNRLPTQIISRTQIASLDQIRGLRIKIDDHVGSAILSQFGARSSILAAADVAPAFARGSIDAAEIFPSQKTVSIYPPGNVKSSVANFRTPAGFFVVDQENWAAFEERQRFAIRKAISSAEKAAQEILFQSSEEIIKQMKVAGVDVSTFSTFPGANRAKIDKAVYHTWQNMGINGSRKAFRLFNKIKFQPNSMRRDKRSEKRLPPNQFGSVYFATDRHYENGNQIEKAFGTRSGSHGIPHCGRVNYLWDSGRKIGDQYGKPLILDGRIVLDHTPCLNQLMNDIVSANGRITIFIHGYNNSFSKGLRRTIAAKTDLNIQNPVLLWSWPSIGDEAGYAYDGESIVWSRPHFFGFVELLLNNKNILTIDLLAHSMGARLGIYSLEVFANGPPKLRNAVYVAADVAQSVFTQHISSFREAGSLRTLYAAELDRALQVSTTINREVRAGIGGRRMLISDSIESIDVSPVESGFWDYFQLNHAHAFNVPEVVTDLSALLTTAQSARERGLEEHSRAGLPFWLIQPDT